MRGGDETIDIRRHLDAVRRAKLFIALLVISATTTAVILSNALPDEYKSTTRLVFQETGSVLGTTDTEAVRRELSTTDSLLTTPLVLRRATASIPGSTREELGEKVESSVDEDANIIDVEASDGSPKRAAAIANGVSEAFIAERTKIDRERLERARKSLLAEIESLQGSANSAPQVQAIRQRISELTVALASAGSDLQIAERAEPAKEPSAPRPLRNGVLAFAAALFLGILLALGRDLLVPRIGGARDLSRLTRLTVLAGVPYVRTMLGRRRRYASAAEDEAYQTLRAWVELELPPEQTRLLLLTSAVHSEGKTTVTARLGQALAEAGYGVLLVSADLRRPTLHDLFGVELGTGTADILEEMVRDPQIDPSTLVEGTIVQLTPTGGARGGELAMLTSGSSQEQAVRSLTTEVAHAFYEELRRVGFDYVLIDGPPLLGIADSTVLAQEADDLLVVARLDRLTVENAVDLRELLGRLTTPALGLVAIGTPSETSPYYLPRRAAPPSTGRSTPTPT
jgi:polysaccharide biosynthesis transport protein